MEKKSSSNHISGQKGGTFRFIHARSGSLFQTSLGIAKRVQPKDNTETEGEEKYVPWGSGDNFPVELINDAEKDTVITPGIRFKSEMQYGGGITHGKILIEGGKEIFVPERNPEVVKFLRRSNQGQWLLSNFYDLNYFGITFPMFHMSKDGKKVVKASIENSRAKSCRLLERDRYGDFKGVVVKPQLANNNITEEESVTYKVPDMSDPKGWVEQQKNLKSFIIPIRTIDHGNKYYPVPDWNTARESKWIEISRHIASFKKFLIENQVSLKYLIEIDEDYWPAQFGQETWDSWSPEEKRSNAEEAFNEMSDWLTDLQNSGASMSAPLKSSPHFADKQISMIKFTPIENKFSKEGAYIEDSKEASDHKMSSLGLHPELLGSSPGNKMGAGSGSGNRVAFNQRVSMAKPTQDLVLQVLYIVSEINGWDEELEFRIRESLITTLDTGAEATKPTAQ